MSIYLGNLKDVLVSLETMMLETDKLTARMEKVKNTIRLICDDLEAESKHMDEWANQKEKEVLEAMELVEIQRSKYQEPQGETI